MSCNGWTGSQPTGGPIPPCSPPPPCPPPLPVFLQHLSLSWNPCTTAHLLLYLLPTPLPLFIKAPLPALQLGPNIRGPPLGPRGLSGLRLSEFVQISEFFGIYITDICQTSESFAKSVNLKWERAVPSVKDSELPFIGLSKAWFSCTTRCCSDYVLFSLSRLERDNYVLLSRNW